MPQTECKRCSTGTQYIWILLCLCAVTLPGSPLLLQVSGESGTSTNRVKGNYVRAWAGLSTYRMGEFNTKLAAENNQPIDKGLNAGVEFNAIDLPLAQLKFNIPVGFEFLDAASKTTHEFSNGSVTVNWTVPVVGVYFAPEITSSKPGWQPFVRPISVGLYDLGKIIPARLTVSDRSGSLDVSGRQVGVGSYAGVRYARGSFIGIFEIGYRRLQFSNVNQKPRGGFPDPAGGSPIPESSLRETLDYSGFVARVGIGIQFGGGKGDSK